MPKEPTVERILNCIELRDKEKDWSFLTAVEASVCDVPAEIPPKKYLREDWWKISN